MEKARDKQTEGGQNTYMFLISVSKRCGNPDVLPSQAVSLLLGSTDGLTCGADVNVSVGKRVGS